MLNYNVRFPVDISLVDFLWKEKLLVATALVSGGMLIWPQLRKTSGGPSVSHAEATHWINREDALVVDVREAAEYGAGHILGAKNMPLARIDEGGGELAKKKDRPLIVYCDAGERSSKAASALRRHGFARVASLSGGLNAWRQAGLPVEK